MAQLFNLWFGQAQPAETRGGSPVRMYHRRIRPEFNVLVQDPENGDVIISLTCDDYGVVEVPNEHVGEVTEMGWPRYVGDRTGAVKPEDLEFHLEPQAENPWRPLSTAEHEMHTRQCFESWLHEVEAMGSIGGPLADAILADVERTIAGNTPDLSKERARLAAIEQSHIDPPALVEDDE